MSDSPVQVSIRESVAHVQLDDGKANALSPAVIAALGQALDRAEKEEARGLVLSGRPGRFSAGFDLSVMKDGPAAASAMVLSGADLAIRLFSFPAPVVLAVTGHALAMGSILCMSGDERIGAEGNFKIGLNEVAIGMTLPDFGIEFARERLSRRHLGRAVSQAHIYDPSGAVDAGYLDEVRPAEEVVEAALERAAQLATTLNARAHRETKLALRAESLERLRACVARDRARAESA